MLAGVKTKCQMFAFRLSHSGKAIHRIYPTQAQEAFLEGHIDAFADIGGIPTRHIRYDNLTDAVVKVIYGTGRQRTENQRWLLFRSHYGFDAFYCHPGIEGAHEKGGIEGDVGRFRRTHLSPMPVVDSLAELNQKVRQWDLDDEDRRIGDRLRTIARYGRVDLLMIDELGYMELDRRGAELLFQVLTEREENNSIAIASNESFSGWTKTFTDPRLCAAIVDRLTFKGTIIETGTDSYRLAHTKQLQA